MTVFTPPAEAGNTRQGFCKRWISRFTATPSGIYDPRTIKSYDSAWVDLGGLNTVTEA